MSVENVMATHPVVVKIFQSGGRTERHCQCLHRQRVLTSLSCKTVKCPGQHTII